MQNNIVNKQLITGNSVNQINCFVLLIVGLYFFTSFFSSASHSEPVHDKTPQVKTEIDKRASEKHQKIADFIKAMETPLGAKPGDQKRGEALFVNPQKGNCIACHYLSQYQDLAAQSPGRYGNMGLVGPDLTDVKNRMSIVDMRLLIANPLLKNPQSDMPGYYNQDGLKNVASAFQGKTILTGQEIEDILAFLIHLPDDIIKPRLVKPSGHQGKQKDMKGPKAKGLKTKSLKARQK